MPAWPDRQAIADCCLQYMPMVATQDADEGLFRELWQ
jgi:hypothetical protein